MPEEEYEFEKSLQHEIIKFWCKTYSVIFSNKWDGARAWASVDGNHTKCPDAATGETETHFISNW